MGQKHWTTNYKQFCMPDLDLLGWVCSSEPWREQGFCSGGQRTQLLRQRGAGIELRGDPVSGSHREVMAWQLLFLFPDLTKYLGSQQGTHQGSWLIQTTELPFYERCERDREKKKRERAGLRTAKFRSKIRTRLSLFESLTFIYCIRANI